MTKETKVNRVWTGFENGRTYQDQIGLSRKLRENVDFVEGRQWPPPTESTKNLPRPVKNICKHITRNKTANILSVPVKLVYSSYKEKEKAERFTRFAEFTLKKLKQKDIDADAIRDGAIKGSYFMHYYWDYDKDCLQCELIDPQDIVFSNPKETDEQKQKHIIIASREEVEAIKKTADAGVDKNLITADDVDSTYENDQTEQEGTELCTVLTRYFKQKGEVFFEKAVKGAIVNKARSLTPDLEKARHSLEDEADTGLPESNKEEETERPIAKLFPIVAGQYEKKEKCIYGMSEVEGLIANQKLINFSTAMKFLAEQNQAWGKIIAKENALQDQVITNVPGQVITDYDKTGQGFYQLPSPQMSKVWIELCDDLITTTRNLAGATEVMSGEAMGANMSGAAIAQLQSQAALPIEALKERFWRVKEKQGRVLEQFFKLYYEDADFTYEDTVENPKTGEKEDKTLSETFKGSEYLGIEFDIVVEATGGARATTASDINMLDNLLAKGAISPLAYVKSYPDDALQKKSEIVKIVEEEEQSVVKQLQATLAQREQQLGESAELLQKQNDTVGKVVSVIQENNRLNAMLAQLYTESKGKIEQANQMAKQYGEVAQDAEFFAQQIVEMQNAGKAKKSNK